MIPTLNKSLDLSFLRNKRNSLDLFPMFPLCFIAHIFFLIFKKILNEL